MLIKPINLSRVITIACLLFISCDNNDSIVNENSKDANDTTKLSVEETNILGVYQHDFIKESETESTQFNWKSDKTFEYCQWESRGDESSPKACMTGNWEVIGGLEESFSEYFSRFDMSSDFQELLNNQVLVQLKNIEQSSPGRVRMAQGYALKVDEEGLKVSGHLSFWKGESKTPEGKWSRDSVTMNLFSDGKAEFLDSKMQYLGTWEEEPGFIDVGATYETENTSYGMHEHGGYFIENGQLVIFDGEDYPTFPKIE